MGNCLITKLKSVVQNDSLPIYGKNKIRVNKIAESETEYCKLQTYGPISMHIVGDGYFISADPGQGHWSDGTNSIGKDYAFQNMDWHVTLLSNGDYDVYIDGKYDPTWISVIGSKNCHVDLEDYYYSIQNVAELSFSNSYDTVGDLAELIRHKTSGQITLMMYNTSVRMSMKELLGSDITCSFGTIQLTGCPNVTDTDSETMAAVRARFPNSTFNV